MDSRGEQVQYSVDMARAVREALSRIDEATTNIDAISCGRLMPAPTSFS